MLRHIVLMHLRTDVSEAEIRDVFHRICRLKEDLPGIMSFYCGHKFDNMLVHNDYTHGYSMDFVDQEYMQHYFLHPDLAAIQQTIRNSLVREDALLVFNYELEHNSLA